MVNIKRSSRVVCSVMRAGCWPVDAGYEERDFGLHGGVGGMTVMSVVAFAMRQVRGGIVAVCVVGGKSEF